MNIVDGGDELWLCWLLELSRRGVGGIVFINVLGKLVGSVVVEFLFVGCWCR